ncbi:lipoyl(octanoyl) transferase LipB [Gordonia pseudamarae]|uniref:Octanoyltransferase n=1 Tax=Gordonia pseudamarae TaxID=2831662 RepID=A0ABX6IP63_9ACTN|nr:MULTISPECIES: lipoyl(octanoyl) transferase LipB [Gordonia]MBD0022591.1 lipoyl(octanoyl) transferase LipB [Gordonia sp. (in: high G+C Gram-positive bacteria)]QHN28701.1 lipoyl(octanoyl) transferase LipB [Gordonia pseudamarae]QHN37575.1 lipoyl(octanoyl) transferase LipB [Gordonia pseudamarae]
MSAGPVEIRRLGVVDYREAYDLQHRLAAERADGILDHDVLLLLEHPSTYTAGKRTEDSDRPTDGSPVIDVDRGGRITWHGPGQLVGYPIIRLAEPLDVVEYVRRLESALIAVCAGLGVVTGRVDGRSGVWISDDAGERKLGQIGIRVARGVALHGFALNVDPDMSAFAAIVPCGIADAGVTSLARELHRPLSVTDVIDDVCARIAEALDAPRPSSPGRVGNPAATDIRPTPDPDIHGTAAPGPMSPTRVGSAQ